MVKQNQLCQSSNLRSVRSILTLARLTSLALYNGDLEEDEEEEEDDEEQLEVHRFPDLLFRRPPQLVQYTAALHSRYGSDDDDDDGSEKEVEIQRERRGELRLVSHIGTIKHTLMPICMINIMLTSKLQRNITNYSLFSVS